jgi:hypothetical protein
MCPVAELAPVDLHKGECPVAELAPVDLDLGGDRFVDDGRLSRSATVHDIQSRAISIESCTTGGTGGGLFCCLIRT